MLGLGCTRFKPGCIRWHKMPYGEAEIYFLGCLKMLCVFGRMDYTLSIRSAQAEYARVTLEVRYS